MAQKWTGLNPALKKWPNQKTRVGDNCISKAFSVPIFTAQPTGQHPTSDRKSTKWVLNENSYVT